MSRAHRAKGLAGPRRALGLLIALEGLDGAGTTTQSERLRDWLGSLGRKVHLTGEPSRGPIGSLLRLFLERRIALDEGSEEARSLGGATLALLFAADRLDHLAHEIVPRLEAGWDVVTDRYVLSSFAYQTAACPIEFVRALNARARAPDLTILLDVPPDVCRRRLEAARWRRELFEERAALEGVARRYAALARGPDGAAIHTVVVDGTAAPDEVHERIRSVVGRLLDPSGARPLAGESRGRKGAIRG